MLCHNGSQIYIYVCFGYSRKKTALLFDSKCSVTSPVWHVFGLFGLFAGKVGWEGEE